MDIIVRSFGVNFKHDFPDTDITVDCRYPLTGKSLRYREEKEVHKNRIRSIMDDSGRDFMDRLKYEIPREIHICEDNGKPRITINFGCQDGRQRSVHVASTIGLWLRKVTDHNVKIVHLDKDKKSKSKK